MRFSWYDNCLRKYHSFTVSWYHIIIIINQNNVVWEILCPVAVFFPNIVDEQMYIYNICQFSISQYILKPVYCSKLSRGSLLHCNLETLAIAIFIFNFIFSFCCWMSLTSWIYPSDTYCTLFYLLLSEVTLFPQNFHNISWWSSVSESMGSMLTPTAWQTIVRGRGSAKGQLAFLFSVTLRVLKICLAVES